MIKASKEATYLTAVLTLVRIYDRRRYYLERRLLHAVFFRPFRVLQSGPGGAVFDLHDPRLRVAGPFREKRDGVALGKRLEGPREEFPSVMRLAVNSNIASRR